MKLQHNPDYANLGPRLLAAGIDGQVTTIVSLYYFNRILQLSSLQTVIPSLLQTAATIWFPVSIGYSLLLLLMLWRTGYTPGKWLAGVQIVDDTGKPLAFMPLLVREWIAKRVSNSILMAGHIAVLFDPRHQTWHDQLVGSYARSRQSNLVAAVLLFGLLTALQGYYWYAGWIHLTNNTSLLGDLAFMVEPFTSLLP